MTERAPAAPVVIPAELVPDRRGAVVVLSSTNRAGDWVVPRLFRIVSFMGNVELDLTNARIGPGESQIEVRCLWANVEITVPLGIRVEIDGHPILGSFEREGTGVSTLSPDAPLVRITGSVVMGAVTINVVDPNAPGFFERVKRALRTGQKGRTERLP